MAKRRLVSIVDDSESVRESLPDLLQHVGLLFRLFHGGVPGLGRDPTDAPAGASLEKALKSGHASRICKGT